MQLCAVTLCTSSTCLECVGNQELNVDLLLHKILILNIFLNLFSEHFLTIKALCKRFVSFQEHMYIYINKTCREYLIISKLLDPRSCLFLLACELQYMSSISNKQINWTLNSFLGLQNFRPGSDFYDRSGNSLGKFVQGTIYLSVVWEAYSKYATSLS